MSVFVQSPAGNSDLLLTDPAFDLDWISFLGSKGLRGDSIQGTWKVIYNVNDTGLSAFKNELTLNVEPCK